MTKKFTPQEIQEIKEYLNGLLDRDADDTASTDVDAIEAAFWERLQPRLFQNPHSSGADQLAKVVQATIDGDDSVGLTSTVLLIPAVDPTVGAAAASTASSSSSKSSKPRKSRKREASATRNRAKASTKKLKTRSASKSASQLQNPLPAVLQVSPTAKPEVHKDITAVLYRSLKLNSVPYRLALPWKGRQLFYDPREYPGVYRAHYRYWMSGRQLFWAWAFHAPLKDKAATDARRKYKWKVVQARNNFLSLRIETFSFYYLLGRLDDSDELFWYGGQPGKAPPEAQNYDGPLAEDLGSLAAHDPPRYRFMLTHALDPDYIDNYGYSCMRSLLESTGALDTEAKEGSRLSEVALAPVRKDVMTKRDVPDTRVGDETKDPWKKIRFHYRIKHLQDRVYADINKGTYQVTEPPSLAKAELDNDDWSDFEDEDGNPTAYPPGTLDPDAREGDGDEAGDDEGSPDTSDAELKAKLNQ